MKKRGENIYVQKENLSDLALYDRFLSGDTSAYDELMLRYADTLILYLNGYLHDWHHAEDLMIEAFARIMVKKPRLREDAFKAYLFKTARNLAARFHEKFYRRKEFSLDELDERSEGETLFPEEKLVEQERREMLHLCLSRIDPQLREAIWLVYFEDMSYEQAGSVMGVGKKRIDHLLSRGKKKLRNELEKEGMTDAYR